MTRRRPKFEQGFADDEAAQPERLSDAALVSNLVAIRRSQNRFLNHERYVYDPIRRKFVRATPEEKIRQNVIRKMVNELGYPNGLIAVEKGIASLSLSDPNRRIDILCYAPGKVGLMPLLLIECKAVKLEIQAERQVLGYNDAIGAPFVALAYSSEIKTFWREKSGIASVPFLPRFDLLVEQLWTI